MQKLVIGIDLSLRSTGICMVAPSWEPASGTWDGVRVSSFGVALKKDASPFDSVVRLQRIRDFVVKSVSDATTGMSMADVAVGIEQYAFTSMNSHAHSLGELGGVVKLGLLEELGIATLPIAPAYARKLLCGKGGGKGLKEMVFNGLRGAGAKFSNTDEADAFVVANAVRADLGMPAWTIVGGR